MPQDPDNSKPTQTRNWYCLRTQTKREHVAAALLSKNESIEVFCPRISQVRKTRQGKKRFVEAMFPGYIFARFDYAEQHRLVMHSQGVSRIVEQGERRVVPDAVIQELIDGLPEGVVEAPDPSIEAGAEIEFVSGSLKGLNAKVLAQLPSGKRVEVLLEFLGQEIKVEADPSDIMLAEGT